ncbi:MAG: VOC family protein [Pseudomonadota bacterium]
MRPELFGLDHLMIATASLPDVRRTYERLGFTVTPYRSNEPMGGGKTGGRGGNHLVMMTATDARMANYLELAYADPAYAAPYVKSLLSRPAGLAMLVHSGEALRDLDAGWQAAGLPGCEVYELNTLFTDDESGVTDRIHFEVLVPTAHQGPFAVNACRYFELNHYRRPDWVAHENGALRWDQVTIVQDDLTAVDAYLQKIYDAAPDRAGDSLSVRVGDQSLVAITPETFTEKFSDAVRRRSDGSQADTAIGILTQSLEKTRTCLAENSVPSIQLDDRLVVPASACDGVILIFHEAAE